MGSFENLISTNPNPKKFGQGGTLSTNEAKEVYSTNRFILTEKDPAINKLLKLLMSTPSEDSITLLKIHLKLMNVYYKKLKADETYLVKSTYHAKEALIKGDLSGMAAFRLTSNLTKEKKFHKAIEVCELVINPSFHFSPNGVRKKPEFDFLLKKLKRKVKTDINPNERLFNDEELGLILVDSGLSEILI